MRQFREIVARNGHLLDDRRGLGFKAYLMRERGSLGSPVNYYGSFYVWTDAAAMAHFLVGGGAYERIVRGLHRLPVETWLPLTCIAGDARALNPRYATRRVSQIPAHVDLDDDGLGLKKFVEEACASFETVASRPDLHTAVLALDPVTWRLLRFECTVEAPPVPADDSEHYEVLHVSVPDIERLPAGRVW
jgi:hypothetical protein